MDAIINFLNLQIPHLGITILEAIFILIIPIIIDLPRAIFKSVYLLLNALYERMQGDKYNRRYTPLLSIIVPAHNEEATIEKTIQSLLEADYPNKEIIIVDDGSTDRTYELALPYASKGLIKLLKREKASGKKAIPVNYGLLFAKGDVVLVVDADTLIERNALRRMIRPLSDPHVGAVSGNVRVANKKNLLTRLQAYEYLMAMEMGRRFQSHVGTLMIIPGAFGAVRRHLLQEVGVYDVDTITEDFDVTIKIHKMKQKVRFVSEAIAWTFVPITWRAWIRQRERWTRGQLQTLLKHRNLFFRSYFGLAGLVGAPDMAFMDIVILFTRTIWFFILPFFFMHNLWMLLVIFILIYVFYFINESFLLVSAIILSPRKRDVAYFVYLPIIVLFYRPFYSLVRVKAYLDELFKTRAKW
jgi:cellulose synthase/poly-beta-1,6-N-acetylglucosamine synthase-like glycosyltransferase